MNDIAVQVVDPEREASLRTIGHISYLLHAIVAVGAVLPGFWPGVTLLVVAFVIDMVKRDDAAGTWQESHFPLAHPQRDVGARALPGHRAAVVPAVRSGVDRLDGHLDLVPLPGGAGLDGPERPTRHARLRTRPMSADPNCIFCKIVAGQIPARKVFEDDELLAFHDINPWAPVHILLIPKRHIASMQDVVDADQALLGRMMTQSSKLMAALGVTGGYRHLINTGPDGRQEVPHLHMHVMGGPRPWAKG